MNPMGVSGFLDNQSIESATLVNEATARGQELLNQEKEYGLMSGMTQRGMAADVAGKEMETAYRKSLIDDIQYGLMDKRATETERRAAEKVKLLVESVTDKAFLEVVKANPGAANRAAYATLIGDKDIATAEKAHTMAAELGMNVAEAYKVSPAYAGQLLEQGMKRIKDVYGVDTAPMFGGVDFKSPDAETKLQAWTAGHMDINKLIEHRFKLEEQTQKATYDVGLKQFESELNKDEETHKANLAKVGALNANEHMLPNGSKVSTSELRQMHKAKFKIMDEEDFKMFSIINKDNPDAVKKERSKIDNAPPFDKWARTEYGVDVYGKMPTINQPGTKPTFNKLPEPSANIGAEILDNQTGKILTPKKVGGVWKWVPK